LPTPSKNPTAEARVPDRFSRASTSIGIVARDPVVFRSVVDAFEAGDSKLFQHILAELRVDDDCEVICAWLRSKESVLECLEVCGPPQQPVTVEQVVRFADVVANLSQNEFLTRRLVDAVQDRDSVAFKTVVAELGAEQFCHLLCHWTSVVRYRLICEVVCGEQDVQTDQVVAELARAGAAVGQLAKKSVTLRSAITAAVASDVDSLSDIVGGFVDCHLICEWFCSWRCVWVCLSFCESFPLPEIKDPIEEMREFALFSAKLAENKEAFPRLLAALQTGDPKSFAAQVKEFEAGRYCMQLCHWLCFEICRRWCFVICVVSGPGGGPTPMFTQVGNLNIFSDISSQANISGTPATGLTVASISHAADYAFYGPLQLNGTVPAYSSISPSIMMKYRFLFAASVSTSTPSTTAVPGGSPLTTATILTAGINNVQTNIPVKSVAGLPSAPGYNVAIISTGEIMKVTGVSGNTLNVLRAQNGTTAFTAGINAALSTIVPITGALLYPVTNSGGEVLWPVEDPSTMKPWPAFLVPWRNTSQPVVIAGAAPSGSIPDTSPPLTTQPYAWPDNHYILADTDGWVDLSSNPETGFVWSGFSLNNLLGFDTTQVVPAGNPAYLSLPATTLAGPSATLAGLPVPAGQQYQGMDMLIMFEATRSNTDPPGTTADYYQQPTQLRVNNWPEINQLNFSEFASPDSCCTPINDALGVEFTVDHEDINEPLGAGSWSLEISSCAIPTDDITPPQPPSPPTPGVTLTNRGGFGTIPENTTSWPSCSYTVKLTTTPALTTGIFDRSANPNSLTFCICGH
jgi:hypothetical protein